MKKHVNDKKKRRLKESTRKARKERAKLLFKTAHTAETLALDLKKLRDGNMLTVGEKAVLLHADEMYTKAGHAVRRVALRLDQAR